MANRHTHKKLRAEVRARMAATGESHQTALNRILADIDRRKPSAPAPVPDLIAIKYFGVDLTVAVFDVLSHLRVIAVSGTGGPLGLPFGSPLPFRVHMEAIQ